MDSQLLKEIDMLYNQVCQGIGDPKRLMLIHVIADKPLCVNDIAAELALPQSTVSRHLKILRERSLVIADRRGASVYYSVADKRLIQALDLMREMLRDRIIAQAQVIEASAPDAGE